MNKVDEKQNSGFIFGLTLGAAVGAVSAILIKKNSNEKVVKLFENKVKDFFEDLIDELKTKEKDVVKKVESIAENVVEKVEPIITHKKPMPKMFVKPKK